MNGGCGGKCQGDKEELKRMKTQGEMGRKWHMALWTNHEDWGQESKREENREGSQERCKMGRKVTGRNEVKEKVEDKGRELDRTDWWELIMMFGLLRK